jgi:hypothetical protein
LAILLAAYNFEESDTAEGFLEDSPLSNCKALQHNINIHKFNPTLERAVDKAEIATEWWGKKSSKAKLAWEEVEDIATHDMSEVMKGAINEGVESLTKPLETSTAMKELERVLFVAKKAKQNQ